MKDFVQYEETLELKQLGFDEPCLGWFASDKTLVKEVTEKTDFTLAPTYSQAFRWFREKYDLDGWVVPYYALDDKMYNYLIMNRLLENLEDDVDCEIYEEAQLECLKKLIEMVKEK